MERPAEVHLLAAKKILFYLQGTKDLGLFYKQGENQVCLVFLTVIMLEIWMTESALQDMFLS